MTWFDPPPQHPDWSPAVRQLAKADPVLRRVMQRVGPCTLAPRGDPFTSLCRAIFSQQLSTKVAATLFARFTSSFPAGKPTPARVLKLLEADPESARRWGLSRQKETYLRDLAEKFAARQIPLRSFPRMSDQEIIESLIAIKGIGRWTAEMFLIFVLNRPDLLPVDDLGVRRGVQIFYALPELPAKHDVLQLGEKWRPWRSVATWYLWRGQDAVAPPAPPKPSRAGRRVK